MSYPKPKPLKVISKAPRPYRLDSVFQWMHLSVVHENALLFLVCQYVLDTCHLFYGIIGVQMHQYSEECNQFPYE